MTERLLVLAWHNVRPTWAFPESSSSAAQRGFLRQLRLLQRHARVVPLRSALDHLSAGRPLPERAVALTFDDGYADNATVAAPLLQSLHMPATFFLVPGFLSGSGSAWWEDLCWAFAQARAPQLFWKERRFELTTQGGLRSALDTITDDLKGMDHHQRLHAVSDVLDRLSPEGPRPSVESQFMGWDEAKRLLDAGHEIGSHTLTHPILAREHPDVQWEELAGSRHRLESALACPVDVLSIPNGREVDYDDTTLRLAEQAGYRYAVTTRSGFATREGAPYEVRRVLLQPESDLRWALFEGLRAVKRTVRQTWLSVTSATRR